MRIYRLTLMALCLMIATGSVVADEQKTATKSTAVELKKQTRCPVMGGKIDSTVFTDIQGQRVYHCCPGCKEKLVADPDKYFQKAAAQSVLFENVQKSCPVSGEALEDKDVYTDFEGRRIYFCCKKCQKQFTENPLEYLKKMEGPEKTPSSDGRSKDDHSSHGGH